MKSTILCHAFLICILVFAGILAAQSPKSRKDKGPEYRAVHTAIQSGQLDAAAKLLDYHLSNLPQNHDLWLLRRALANAYARKGKREQADQQLESVVQYIISSPDRSLPLLQYLPQLLVNISYVQRAEEPMATKLLDPVLELMIQRAAEFPANASYSSGVSSIVNFKARTLTRYSLYGKAAQLYKSELQRLRLRTRTSADDPNHWFQLAYNLRIAADTIGDDNDESIAPWRWERANILNFAVRDFPKSSEFVEEYFSEQLRVIAEYEKQTPDHAIVLYREALNRLKQVAQVLGSNRSLVPLQVKIEKRHQRVSRIRTQANIAGSAAPKLGAIRWIQSGRKNQADTDKRSTILYFSGWQIRAEPQELLDLSNRLELSDRLVPDIQLILPVPGKSFQGLRSFPGLSSMTEQQQTQRIEEFRTEVLEPNQFSFSVGITSNPVSVADQFGITETPFAVIISKSGIVVGLHSGNEIANSVVNSLSK